jgi:hypothetical protein
MFLSIIALCTAFQEKSLVLIDTVTEETIRVFPFVEGGVFSVSFIHSVNQSPVEETYQIRNNTIFLIGCRFSHFGAGVLTELGPNERLLYNEDGSMSITGIETPISELSYIVGTVSDHILEISGEKISLRTICGKNRKISFVYR